MLLLLTSLAQAQQLSGLDAHGFNLTSLTPNPTAPLRVYQPQAFEPYDPYAGIVVEFAKEPLTLVSQADDGTLTQVDVVDDLLAFNLGAGVAVHQRLRVEVGLPFYGRYTRDGSVNAAAPTAGLGDLRLAAHVSVLRPDPGQDGLAVAVVPFIDLPTGMEDQFLGQPGVAGGGRLAASLRLDRLVLGADAGVIARPATAQALNLTNPVAADVGAHVGFLLTESLGINLEATSRLPLAANTYPGTERPTELTASLHGVQDSGLTWVVGGAVGLSPGAGAADWRLLAGVGWGKVPEPPPEEPTGPEEGDLAIEVLLDGRRVVNAPIDVDGARPVALVSAAQPIPYENLAPGDVYTASVQHGPCMEGTGQATVVANETTPLVVELEQRLEAQVRVEIYDADDKPLNGGIVTWERELENCVPGAPLKLKDTHKGRQSVGVGEHTVFVTVEGYNTYVETVTLKEGDDELIIVKLAPTKVQVTDERIEILEKVYFEFDGDQIEPRSADLLNEVAIVLRSNPDILRVEVAGHTDDKGSDDYNLDLSQRRVDSVTAWLVAAGVDEDRLVAKGYGETKPIADNSTPEGRAENRRVEFRILERAPVENGAIIRIEDGDGPTKEQIDSGRD